MTSINTELSCSELSLSESHERLKTFPIMYFFLTRLSTFATFLLNFLGVFAGMYQCLEPEQGLFQNDRVCIIIGSLNSYCIRHLAALFHI